MQALIKMQFEEVHRSSVCCRQPKIHLRPLKSNPHFGRFYLQQIDKTDRVRIELLK
jgi:hypothetical protein